jgi:hypothetical protein
MSTFARTSLALALLGIALLIVVASNPAIATGKVYGVIALVTILFGAFGLTFSPDK